MTDADREQVSTLLKQSKAAHDSARAQYKRGYDLATSVPRWREALRLRMEAHALDPEHESDAWRTGPRTATGQEDQHASILSFYERYGVTP